MSRSSGRQGFVGNPHLRTPIPRGTRESRNAWRPSYPTLASFISCEIRSIASSRNIDSGAGSRATTTARSRTCSPISRQAQSWCKADTGISLSSICPSFPCRGSSSWRALTCATGRRRRLRASSASSTSTTRFTTPAFARPHNETEAALPANPVGRRARSLAYRVLGRGRARRLQSRLPGLVQRPFLANAEIPHVSLDPAVRATLEAFLGEDADRLRRLTGLPFETWTV